MSFFKSFFGKASIFAIVAGTALSFSKGKKAAQQANPACRDNPQAENCKAPEAAPTSLAGLQRKSIKDHFCEQFPKAKECAPAQAEKSAQKKEDDDQPSPTGRSAKNNNEKWCRLHPLDAACLQTEKKKTVARAENQKRPQQSESKSKEKDKSKRPQNDRPYVMPTNPSPERSPASARGVQ